MVSVFTGLFTYLNEQVIRYGDVEVVKDVFINGFKSLSDDRSFL